MRDGLVKSIGWTSRVVGLAVLLIFPQMLCAQPATGTFGVGIVPSIPGNDDAERNLLQGLVEAPQIGRNNIYAVNTVDDLLQTLVNVRTRAGRQVNVLVICGHGSRETPGLQLGGAGPAGQLIWEDIDLGFQKNDQETARYLLAHPELPAAKTRTPQFLQNRVRDDTARIDLLERVTDVMANDGVIILLNCSAAATAEGRKYVMNVGRAFLGKRGGRIVASRVDVMATNYDMLWQWVLNKLYGRPPQMLFHGDFVVFPVLNFTGAWKRKSSSATGLTVDRAVFQEAGSKVTGFVYPHIGLGITPWSISSDEPGVRTVGDGVKQFRFQVGENLGIVRIDVRKPLEMLFTLQVNKPSTTGSPFQGGVTTESYGETVLEFEASSGESLSAAPGTTGVAGGDMTQLALTISSKTGNTWIVPPAGQKRAIGSRENMPQGTEILLDNGASIEAVLAPASISDPTRGLKLSSTGPSDFAFDGKLSLRDGQILYDSEGSDPQTAPSLSVGTPNALVEPIGTHFDVRFDRAKQTTAVRVLAGRVRVTPTLSSQSPAVVNPGESITVGPDGMGKASPGEPGVIARGGPQDGTMPPFDGDVNLTDPVAVPLAKGPGLWADSRSVLQGQVTWLPISALQVNDLASLNAELAYDAAALRGEGARPSGQVSNMLFEGNTNEAGVVRLGWAGKNGMSGTQQVAAVGFRAIGAPGQRVPVRVKVKESVDSRGTPEPLATADGMILIVANRPWSSLDAGRALKMSVGLLPEEKELDVNADGRVTSRDAVVILQLASRRREQ